jgi:AcrR family transcriptional regulator
VSSARLKLTPLPHLGAKLRTYQQLLKAAVALVEEGGVLTVAAVAVRAQIPRATAYRYFPTRSSLVSAVVDFSLGDVRAFSTREPDGIVALQQLFESTFPRFHVYEPQLRAALQISLEHEALSRAGALREEHYRRGYRVAILEKTTQPLKKKLKPVAYRRLLSGLALVYGIEPYVVFKDILGMNSHETEKMAIWVMQAMVEKALRDGSKEPLEAGRPAGAAASAARVRKKA